MGERVLKHYTLKKTKIKLTNHAKLLTKHILMTQNENIYIQGILIGWYTTIQFGDRSRENKRTL